jgi:hypothetical protein
MRRRDQLHLTRPAGRTLIFLAFVFIPELIAVPASAKLSTSACAHTDPDGIPNANGTFTMIAGPKVYALEGLALNIGDAAAGRSETGRCGVNSC